MVKAPKSAVKRHEASKSKRALMLERATTAIRSVANREAAKKSNVLSERVRESLLRQTPLLINGIWKHSGDAVKPWFTIVKPGTKTRHPGDAEFQAWCRSINLEARFRDFLVDGHLHGDGYGEYEYADTGSSDSDVPEGAELVNVHRVDPVGVDLELRIDGRYDLVQRVYTDTVRLSPDRYGPYEHRTLAGHVHGLSTVEVAYHVALSLVKGDQTIGEVLYHSGIPREHWQIDDPGPGDIVALQAQILDPTFERAMVTDKDTEAKVLNPSGIDPRPYHDWAKLGIAAAIGMPVMILEGAQAGAVIGSETNIAAYQSDLAMTQRLVLNPEAVRIVAGRLGLSTDEFEIRWNDYPMLPSVDAQIRLHRASAMNLYKGAGLTVEAAARLAGVEIEAKDLADTVAPVNGQLSPDAAVDGELEEDDEVEQDEEAPPLPARSRNGRNR